MAIRYGYRAYVSDCPFCGKTNKSWDGTAKDSGDPSDPNIEEYIEESFCPHFSFVMQGAGAPDMVYRLGKNQKSGV